MGVDQNSMKTEGGLYTEDEVQDTYEKGVTNIMTQVEYIRALNCSLFILNSNNIATFCELQADYAKRNRSW